MIPVGGGGCLSGCVLQRESVMILGAVVCIVHLFSSPIISPCNTYIIHKLKVLSFL